MWPETVGKDVSCFQDDLLIYGKEWEHGRKN